MLKYLNRVMLVCLSIITLDIDKIKLWLYTLLLSNVVEILHVIDMLYVNSLLTDRYVMLYKCYMFFFCIK